MFTQLRFQNFKSWKDTGEIRMAPLTGFFGTNSSGKTAILQFLLMLKQTVESSDRNQVLYTGNNHSYVSLGTTYDLIHQHFLPTQLFISIQWKASNDYQQANLPLPPDGKSSEEALGTQRYSGTVEFNSSINFTEGKVFTENFFYNYSIENGKNLKVGMLHESQSSYKYLVEGNELIKTFLPSPENLLLPPIKMHRLPHVESVNLLMLFGELALCLDKQLENLLYLGPLREYPQRIYNWSGEQPQDVGQRGENAVAALLASRKEDPQVQEKVGFWLKELKLIHEYKLEPIRPDRQEYEMLVRCTAGSSWVSIKDVGFGISQILPVLVLCYYAPKGSTIIFEQPEIHLHPSVQAGLADVFIDAIKTRDVQIIIESHSEHLLRRLQRRIAEEKQGMTNQDTALYFCQMGEDGASILDPLQLDPYGNINNWPANFFGDEMGDLVAMTEAAMQRQMQEQSL